MQTQSIGAGFVRGVGELSSIELQHFEPGTQRYESPRSIGACTLLGLHGSLSWRDGQPDARLFATISRESDTGLQVLGGHVRRARALQCELFVEVFADLRLERAAAAGDVVAFIGGSERTVQDGANESRRQPASSGAIDRGSIAQAQIEQSEIEQSPVGAAPVTEQPSGEVSWGAVAAASEAAVAPPPRPLSEVDLEPGRRPITRRKPKPSVPVRASEAVQKPRPHAADFLDVPDPEVGDFVDHKQFGICKVEGIDDDGGMLLKLPTSRRRRIKIDVFDVQPPAHDAKGRRVFKLLPRKR